MKTDYPSGSAEPVLEMNDIQGMALPGFLKPHHTLLAVQMPAAGKALRSFQRLLHDLLREISTAAVTLDDRRAYRRRLAGKRGKPPGPSSRGVFVGIGFSYGGLRRLSPGAEDIPSEAFRRGLAARSALLGDPLDPANEGNPRRWVVGGARNDPDALVDVAGEDRQMVNKRAASLRTRFRKTDCRIVYEENGDVRPDLPGHEHFGFDDGISQPGIRGRASQRPDDFITKRYIDARQQPEAWLYGYPGQDLVWPGEFILGYPASSPDPLLPGLPSPCVPPWTRNGSFLVFRRLRQDVGLFWRTMREKSQELSRLLGFEGMTDVHLAALLVGRWPSGAPVNRVPNGDDPKLGDDPRANNHFRFDSDTVPLPLKGGVTDRFPQAKADPVGIACPWSAHIRKLNTRDSASDLGGRESTYANRILRVGVPFGPPLKNRHATMKNDPARGRRGLLFLGVQASIENQFEFLQARWLNDPARPKLPGGHDLLVGQNGAPGQGRVRRCSIFGSGLQQAEVATSAQWVIPTGGGYFFVPSISAIKEVLG